jgi:hypothetical protein
MLLERLIMSLSSSSAAPAAHTDGAHAGPLSDVPEMRLIMKMAFFFIFINAINKAQR